MFSRIPSRLTGRRPCIPRSLPGGIRRRSCAGRGGVHKSFPRACPSTARRKQEGVFLLELGLALMLALIGATWAGAHVMQAVRDGQAEATGTYLLAVKGAMDAAIAGNFQAYARGLPLTNADGSARYVNAMAPTLAELRALGHLPNGFPDITPAGQHVRILVRRDAARCPGVGCRVDALIHTTTPFRAALGDIDYGAAALAVGSMQGWGGAAWHDKPAEIRGAAFTQDNPVSASAGGIVGVMSMLDTSMWNQFVRVGDDRDPALQGNLSIQGNLSAQRVGIRQVVLPNTACTPTDFANPASTAVQALDLTGNTEYAKTEAGGLAACVNGRWRSVSVVATAGQACGNASYPEGTIGTDVTGAGLLCRDSTWSPLSQWLSRYTFMAAQLAPQTLTAAATSTTVAKPACGVSGGTVGTPGIHITPQSLQNRGSFVLNGSRVGDNINVTGTMTLDPLNFRATNSGSTWAVAVPANSQALIWTYCSYS